MKKHILKFLFVFLVFFCSCSNNSNYDGGNSLSNEQIDNLVAFAKIYGLVKYFHPSSESEDINWNNFAIVGVREVLKATNNNEAKEILEKLFLPIAPSMQIDYQKSSELSFNSKKVIPQDTNNYRLIYWKHYGNGRDFPNSTIGRVYKSYIVNKDSINSTENTFSIYDSFDLEQGQCDSLVLSGMFKIRGDINCKIWIKSKEGNNKYYSNESSMLINADGWEEKKLPYKIKPRVSEVLLGCDVSGIGECFIDDFNIIGESCGISIKNDFESEEVNTLPESIKIYSLNSSYEIKNNDSSNLSKYLQIELVNTDSVHNVEYITKDLENGLIVSMPRILYYNNATYPPSPSKQLIELEKMIFQESEGNFSFEDKAYPLANVIITWNVFEHFYPYFDAIYEISTGKISREDYWNKQLKELLRTTYKDKNHYDHLLTLRRLVALLQDGHGRVYYAKNKENSNPPFKAEWIENSVVVTEILNTKEHEIQIGDVITKINGEDINNIILEKEKYISAATLPYKKKVLIGEELFKGKYDSNINLTFKKSNGTEISKNFKRTNGLYYTRGNSSLGNIKEIKDEIFYIDLRAISYEDFQDVIERLVNAKGIIFDMRGYPKKSITKVLQHLTDSTLRSSKFMIPVILEPDYIIVKYDEKGRWTLPPLNPKLNADIIFLTDNWAISYAESIMEIVEYYNLGKIIGVPTAGTNGNANVFYLPGGYNVNWTGMKVMKQDSSRLHGVGVIPDIYLERTIKGTREERDEAVEKAIEILEE